MNQITVPAIKLFIISFVCALLLGLCSEITKAPIAAQEKKTQDEAMMAVLPDATFEEINIEPSGTITKVNEAKDSSGNTIGYVINCSPSGFGGSVNMMVGVDTEGTLTGLRVLTHSETPGLGAKSTEPEFYEQFSGKSGNLSVNKDGGDIAAITGATITSRAVTSGANEAIQWVSEKVGLSFDELKIKTAQIGGVK